MTIFSSSPLTRAVLHPHPSSAPSFFSSTVSGSLIRSLRGGKGGRSILVSAAQRTSLPVTAGQVSAGGEAAATQRARVRASVRTCVRLCVCVWGGSEQERESPPHGSRANEPSGPAQGRAPPVDKRSILSISLSALDNKQKFSTPRSCLTFEMRIVVR